MSPRRTDAARTPPRAAALGALACLVALSGLQACAPGGAASGEDDLIGGKKATPLAFPSTVYLPSGCTGALIGPRQILTAAHCVLDPATLRPKSAYKQGASLSIVRDPTLAPVMANVADASVSPSWLSACSTTYCGPSEVTGRLDAADFAVIVTVDDVADVPVAPVDTATPAEGDAIILVGFGCDQGVLSPDTRPTKSLAWAESVVIPASSAVHDGSFLTADGVATAAASYFMSPGPALDPNAPGLCPGDSGGPVYRRGEDGAYSVIGVNANYTLQPESIDPNGLPVTNWHTRLDDGSRFAVADWLRGIGADVP